MLSEALFIPFLDNGNLYFSKIYGIDSTTAGTYLVLPYLFCAILCPFLGLLIDKIKWRSVVIIFSCLMFVITYGGMMFLEYQEQIPEALIVVPLILLGRIHLIQESAALCSVLQLSHLYL
jgi:nitrate/nitrite transporter NarK